MLLQFSTSAEDSLLCQTSKYFSKLKAPFSILSMAERSPCDFPSPTNSVGQSNRQPEHTDCLNLNFKNSKQKMSSDDTDELTAISPKLHQPSDNELEMYLTVFEHWPQRKQTQYVEKLVSRMSSHQNQHIYSILNRCERETSSPSSQNEACVI